MNEKLNQTSSLLSWDIIVLLPSLWFDDLAETILAFSHEGGG